MIRKALLGAIAAAAVVSTAPAYAATANLKLTTCLARNHDYTQALMQAFTDPLNAKKADVHIQYLGGPEVTPRKEQASALKRGLIDMILCPAAYYGGMFGAARLPGAQNVSVDEARKNGAWDMLEHEWEKHLNGHLLAWVYSDGQVFYTYFTEKPKLSKTTGLDLHGMKIRSTGLYNPFLKAMGATTVDMSPGDVYAALQRGVVTGLAWPWGSIGKYGWQKFLKYRVTPSFFGPSQMLVVNLDKWKGLSKEQQDMLTKQARVLEKEGGAIIVKKGHEDDKKLDAAGVKDIALTGAEAKAYLHTIYGAKWAQNDAVNKGTQDYAKLKSLLYKQ